jgi:hypothetical protein
MGFSVFVEMINLRARHKTSGSLHPDQGFTV